MSKTINQNAIDKLYQLIETLESLNLAVDTITRRRNKLISRNTRRGSASLHKPRRKNRFKVGDLVQVKDNYRGRKGIKGIITKVHPAQVFLAPIDGITGFRKYKENVKLLKKPSNHEQQATKHKH